MTKLLPRLRFPMLCLAMLSALYLFFGAVHGMGMAHAAVVVGDPVTISTATIDAGWNMITTYGWTWGGMYLAFTLASWGLKRNESEHWIAQGKTLAYITAGVGIAITALQAHFGGSPWSGVAMTVAMALFKLKDPTTVTGQSPSMSTAGVAAKGAVTMLALVLIGGAVAQASCGSPKAKAIESAIWDCTAPERAEAVAAVTPAVVSVIKAAASADGKAIDLSTVKSAIAKANVLSEAGILLSCAAASAFAILEAPAAPAPPGSVAAASLALDPAALRATWAQIDSSQLGGARFATSHGPM